MFLSSNLLVSLAAKNADENFNIKVFWLHFLESNSGGQGKVERGTPLNKSVLPPSLSQNAVMLPDCKCHVIVLFIKPLKY